MKRIKRVKDKLAVFAGEVAALRGESIAYRIGFGLLLVLLSPLLLLEIIFFLLAGKDPGMFPAAPPVAQVVEIRPEEVPTQLRQLLPLAIKWGSGNPDNVDELLDASSEAEREELRQQTAPHMQAIADWLDSQPEEVIGQSGTAGLFIGLMCAYEQACRGEP